MGLVDLFAGGEQCSRSAAMPCVLCSERVKMGSGLVVWAWDVRSSRPSQVLLYIQIGKVPEA